MNYYFAYGANMNYKTFLERCAGAKFVDVGILRGYRFIINARGVASLVSDVTHNVYGIIWRITQEHEAMLDLYEGVAANYYHKQTLHIEEMQEGGNTLSALVYVATDNDIGILIKPYYLDIVRSARYYRFPKDYLEYLHSMKAQDRIMNHLK